MKLIIKIILILTLSITYSYSACNFKAELGIKRAEFESKEIVGAPLPGEYGNLDFYGILAEDICPEQNLKDIAINKAEVFSLDSTEELSIEKIIDEDYIFNGLAKNAIDYITGFNGYTYTLPLRYYIHLKDVIQGLDKY